jgi:murein DD-endopeptidase MepM/ murein hydrolase activator NlpD
VDIETQIPSGLGSASVKVLCTRICETFLMGNAYLDLSWEKVASASNKFLLPFPDGTNYKVTAGNSGHHVRGKNAPFNRYAWDFAMPEGSPVVAARSGRVVSFYEGSQRNSYEQKNGHLYNNYVVIDHGGGQSTLYAHLKFNSVIPKIGDWVEQNQKIAESGNTGNSEGPHLHYSVQKTPSKNYGNTSYGYWTTSLPSSFSDPDVLRQNPNGVPTTGNFYTS